MPRLCRIFIDTCHLISFLGLFANWLVIICKKKKKKPKEIPAKDLDQLLLAVLLIIISSINDVENVICLSSMMRTSSLTFSSMKQSIDQVSIFFLPLYTHVYPSSLTNYEICCHPIYWLIDDGCCFCCCCCFVRHALCRRHRQWVNLIKQ